jgi:hypothetical protein
LRRLIEKALRHECFAEAPPVFLDIGASGALPALWRPMAPHSVCVAFDADARDFEVRSSSGSGWKALHTLNRLVAPAASAAMEFHLTDSPHCSSTLRPDAAALEPWAFHSLFRVSRTVTLPAVDLGSVLAELGLRTVDWFKCDSQGTDLRIFRSLDRRLGDRVLAADFEPGIIDAYEGEDKLHHLLAYMQDKPFWVSDMQVKGSQRIDAALLGGLSAVQRRAPGSFLRQSPGWCEISYLNTCDSSDLRLREHLLGWVFACAKDQHGFAMGLAMRARERFDSDLCAELAAFSRAQIDRGYGRLAIDACKKLFGRRGR